MLFFNVWFRFFMFFFFKQKTAYEMRISDWSSDVCSSDLQKVAIADASRAIIGGFNVEDEYFMPDHPESWHDYGVEVEGPSIAHLADYYRALFRWSGDPRGSMRTILKLVQSSSQTRGAVRWLIGGPTLRPSGLVRTLKSDFRSEEHTSELQSLMRISYAVFCLINKQQQIKCS